MADDFQGFETVNAPGAATDEFAGFEPVMGGDGLAPLSEQGSAALEAGGRAALEMSGSAAGAALGVKAGMAAAPFLGPAAPLGPIVGGVGGFMLGGQAGTLAAEGGLGLRAPEQMPSDVRPGAYFGQSFGGAAPFAVAPFAIASTGLRFAESAVGRLLNNIVNTAKTQPLRFAAAELSTMTSAAGAAGMAEAVAPGRPGVRMGAELAGGILNPTAGAIAATRYGTQLVNRVMSSVSPAARETAAGKALSEIMQITGEDPQVLARLLRDPRIVGESPLTPAQITGSPALGALEQYLAKVDQQFGQEAAGKARDALDVLRGQALLLTKTGDPAALAAAQELRATYVRTIIDGRIKLAQDEALKKVGGIAKDTPEAREALSKAARESLDLAIADARKAETDLWSKVDATRPVQIDNLQSTFDEIVGDTLPELRGKKMPKVVRDFIDRVSSPTQGQFEYDPDTLSVRPMTGDVMGTNAGEMRKLRSELLAMARGAARDPDQVGMERIYNELAEAVLDDMDVAFRQAGDAAYDEARTFSREFNDTFTRSFAGKVRGEGKYGDRIAPELLLRKALATGKEAGALQMRELEEATRFMQTRGLGDDAAINMMLDAQERMVRLAAADAIDPKTGRVNPDRVTKFIKDNATLMNRFPEIRADLQAAVKSEAGLRRLENRAKNIDSVIANQKDFGMLLGGTQDPARAAQVAVKAAGDMLLSRTLESDLVRLINTARGGAGGRAARSPQQAEDAVAGLRAAVFQAALDRSMRSDGTPDLSVARQFLFSPNSVGQKSTIDVLREQGAIDPKMVQNIEDLFQRVGNIERAARPGVTVTPRQDMMDVGVATLSRMIGSTAAGATARAAGSATPSLIVHGAGARMAETIATKIPTQTVNKVLVDAMNDPQKMALLLTKADSPDKAAAQARQIHAWLVQSVLTAGQDQRSQEQPTRLPSGARILAPRTQ